MKSANNNTHKLGSRDNYNASVFPTWKPGLVWTFGGEEEDASYYPQLKKEKPEKGGGDPKGICESEFIFSSWL